LCMLVHAPWDEGVAEKNALCQTCYHAELDRSTSDGTRVCAEVCRKTLPSYTAFRGHSGHPNRHGSIGYTMTSYK